MFLCCIDSRRGQLLQTFRRWICMRMVRYMRGFVPMVQPLFNSLRSTDAYMRQQTRPSLVQIMACRLVGAKPLPKPMLAYFQLKLKEQTSVQNNAFENVVCKIAVVLSRPQCVDVFCCGKVLVNSLTPFMITSLTWGRLYDCSRSCKAGMENIVETMT